ncbi:MAG: helix-turn-helix domain-containing protein [Chloroflexi bacterium]|nr:helix-turn-helix domain-containing protein [Chloroflexota bacterium]MCY3589949.1 helix-turn-helix domain-containing protein [Chloroflexota bacterium]MCY3684610.1 helix-turn-helix domain-containing protein [Chloroflexota bacterium]MDE2709994.1 helix-turn-helix domain-containing protein [Chloroflexota bacterium]
MVKRATFDGASFFAALDGERQARQCTWKRVADESGVSASTLTRISQGKRPDVDSLAALSAWSGLDVDRFVKGRSAKIEPEPLAVISSCLRSDPRLDEDAAAALEQIVKAAYRSMSSPERPE